MITSIVVFTLKSIKKYQVTHYMQVLLESKTIVPIQCSVR